MRTPQSLSGSDLAEGGGRPGDGRDRGFVQGAKSTCASLPRLPGAEESEGGGGAWGELAEGFGVGGGATEGLDRALWPGCLAVAGPCRLSWSLPGPWAVWLLASLLDAAIFLLVLLSGDATRCHLPASLQWLFWACLPGAWVVWKEKGNSGWAWSPCLASRHLLRPEQEDYGLAKRIEPCLPGTKRTTFSLAPTGPLVVVALPGAPGKG